MEENYERVNWKSRKTPLSAKNFNIMDEGIDINRKAIQELQQAVYADENKIIKGYTIKAEVNNRFELPSVAEEGAFYLVLDTNAIYKATSETSYKLVDSAIKTINGGGAQ